MKKMMFIAVIFAMLGMAGCGIDGESSTQRENSQQEQMNLEAQRETGMPAISHFTEKKLLKTILELRDNPKTINYAYLFAENTGKLVFIGKCIGFGIPYATQYTNPQRPAYANETHEQGNVTLPQADPNGLYSPASADGTWLVLIDPKTGDPRITYVEPRIVVSPIPLGGAQ